MTVKRYDAGTLAKAKRLDSGVLQAPALLTRAGVFEYRTRDGKIRRELRPPEEVFHPDSLASFASAPVTEDAQGAGAGHPREGFASPSNLARVAVGIVLDTPRRDGDHVAATLAILNPETIKRIDAGKAFLSCGYSADTDETPGEHPTFGKYDAIQRNIRGNHVAIVTEGRAGPSARLYLDSADGVAVALDLSGDPQSAETVKQDSAEGATVEKFTIDGIEITTSKEGAEKLQALRAAEGEKLQAAVKRADATDAELAEVKARAEKAEKALADIKAAEDAKVKAAEEQKKLDALVEERVKAELAKKAEEVAKAKPIVRVEDPATPGEDPRAKFLQAVTGACDRSLKK